MIGLEDLIRDDGNNFYVNPAVYTREDVFDLEMDRIFHRLWVYVGHESELSEPNDFKVARVGKYQVLITMGEDRRVRGFVNRCTHRGNVLCRVGRGRSKFFRCIYHGWTFNNQGEVVGIPDREGFPQDYDVSRLNLEEVKVGVYKGFIFASVDPINGLEEHLGEAKTFIDYIVDTSPGGIEVRGPVRYAYPGNWKLVMENTIDAYHFPVLHASVAMLANYINNRSPATTAAAAKNSSAYNAAGYLRGGHFFFTLDKKDMRTQLPMVISEGELVRALGKAKGEFRWRCTMHVSILPNLILLDYDESAPTVRLVTPIRPDLTDMQTYVFLPKDLPLERKRIILRAYEEFSGPVGMGSADDNEVMSCINASGASPGPWMNLTKGRHREVGRLGELEEGGIRFEGVSNVLDDTFVRGFYRWWAHYVSGGVK
jgi:benzoate/toluate 1,2-dioxygenase alpha subunit